MRRTSVKAIVVGSVGVLALGATLVAFPLTSASAATPPPVGTLGQRTTQLGCVQGTGATFETCAGVRALTEPGPVVVSADGRHVYVGGTSGGGSVAVLARDSEGRLTQPAGTDGCITRNASEGCEISENLGSITDMVLVGDTLYVANKADALVAILARDPDTGGLSDDGCLQDSELPASVPPGGCTPVKGMPAPSGLAAAPNGSALFVTSPGGDSGAKGTLAVVRLTGTPVPPPPQGANCYASGFTAAEPPAQNVCSPAVGLDNPRGVDVSGDGKNLYVASYGQAPGQGAVAIFNRDISATTLTQPAGTEACIGNLPGTPAPCKAGRAFGGTADVDVSVDGKSVYTAQQDVDANRKFVGGGIVRLDRTAANGQLNQPAGAAGCIVQAGSLGATQGCAVGRGLLGAGSVVVAPDDKNVYTGAAALNAAITAPAPPSPSPSPDFRGTGSSAVAVFDRDAAGAITQDTGERGCVRGSAGEGCTVVRGLNSAGSSPNALAFSPIGSQLYASGNQNRSLAILDRHQTDLALIASAPGQPYVVGRTNSLSLNVQNLGPVSATNVMVEDLVTNPAAAIDATPSQGTCSSPPILCNLGTIATNGQATIVVRFLTTAAGTGTNNARVWADQGDLALSDNSQATPLQAAGPGLTVVSGSGQTAGLGQSFGAPLKAALRNGAGQPVVGIQVTFTAPATSPSALFGSARTETVITDSSGIATSSIPRADSQPGTYNVTASSANVTSVTFSLTNSAASPSPSPSASSTASPRPTTSPTLSPLSLSLTSPGTITPGVDSTMRGVGTPNTAVVLRCYSRTPQNSQPGGGTPAYFDARSVTLSSAGAAVFTLRPGTNTRCFLRYSSAPDGDATSSTSIVQNVASALSLSAFRDGVRQYHFQGKILPRRAGQLITLYRIDGNGSEIRTATTTTDSSGTWRIDRRFTGSGQFTFRARTGQTLTNVSGVSNTRLTIIH